MATIYTVHLIQLKRPICVQNGDRKIDHFWGQNSTYNKMAPITDSVKKGAQNLKIQDCVSNGQNNENGTGKNYVFFNFASFYSFRSCSNTHFFKELTHGVEVLANYLLQI